MYITLLFVYSYTFNLPVITRSLPTNKLEFIETSPFKTVFPSTYKLLFNEASDVKNNLEFAIISPPTKTWEPNETSLVTNKRLFIETSPPTNKLEFIETSPCKTVFPPVYKLLLKETSEPTNNRDPIETSLAINKRPFIEVSPTIVKPPIKSNVAVGINLPIATFPFILITDDLV